MHYLLYITINDKHFWVRELRKDAYVIHEDAKLARKYKSRASFSKAVKKFGLNVLIVGQRPKYMVKKRANNKTYYLSPGEENWHFKKNPESSWCSCKRLALRLSKSKALHYAARLNATIVEIK